MLTSDISMMTLDEFARRNSISRDTAERCMKGQGDPYPDLTVKRVKKKGSKGPGRIYVTARQELAWQDAMQDA
ncbi:hypothetical protein U6G28_02430 [Actinomycetaceae bacterium MB13-C1-2]|nr:hypothetical protein U6G28_02430 [Actinomycetaceae bacterium MB13-C1-2]